MVSSVASAAAAIASAFTSVWLARLASRTLQVQITPSVGIDFDHNASSDRRGEAAVINDGACDLREVHVQVSIPAAFEEEEGALKSTVMKCVGSYDVDRWIIPRVWHRWFKPGERVEIDSADWFTHAREVLSVENLPTNERAMRSLVAIDVTCRRAADNRKFAFKYDYRVHVTDDWKYIALPFSGSNPVDAGSQIILQRKNRRPETD